VGTGSITSAAVSSLRRRVCSRPKESSVPADYSYSKGLIREAMDKTDDGFGATTFTQQFNQFSPEEDR